MNRVVLKARKLLNLDDKPRLSVNRHGFITVDFGKDVDSILLDLDFVINYALSMYGTSSRIIACGVSESRDISNNHDNGVAINVWSITKGLSPSELTSAKLYGLIKFGISDTKDYYGVDLSDFISFRFFTLKPKNVSDFRWYILKTLNKLKGKGSIKSNDELNIFEWLPYNASYFSDLKKAGSIARGAYIYNLCSNIEVILDDKIQKVVDSVDTKGASGSADFCEITCVVSGSVFWYFKDFYVNNDILRVYWKPGEIASSYIEIDAENDMISTMRLNYGKINYLEPLDTYSNTKRRPGGRFITFDMETFTNEDGCHIPYALCIRWGSLDGFYDRTPTRRFFYLLDYEGSTPDDMAKNMIFDALKYLMQGKFQGYKVYVHNLSGYDGPILLKYFYLFQQDKDFKVNLKYNHGTIYQISCSYPEKFMDSSWEHMKKGRPRRSKRLSISFKDSYLLLPVSLGELAKSFECSTQKGSFPHDFASFDNLDYCGKSPVDGSDNWCFRSECEKYINADVDSLYEVLEHFKLYILRDYNLEINSYLSLPSLSMAIFRSAYYKASFQIPLLTGEIERFIRKCYHGGRPINYIQKIIDGYMYDVNSLYPYVMNNPMPVGQPFYVLNPKLNDFYGFCKASVEVPASLNNPPLFTSRNGKTIAPSGKFTGYFYSESLKYAESLGCKVVILEGYEFTRGFGIFTYFVKDLYDKKVNASSKAIVFIVKLILNSLYGKFGMHEPNTECRLVSQNEFDIINRKHHVLHYTLLPGGHSYLVEFESLPMRGAYDDEVSYIEDIVSKRRYKGKRHCSIGISAAIAAEGWIYMQKISQDLKVYYLDTDSLVLDKPLPKDLVNNSIGKFKLENKIKEGYFVKGKFYWFLNEHGKEIIKSAGLKSNLLCKDHFLDLYHGKSIKINTTKLSRDIKKGHGIIENRLVMEISPLYNYTSPRKLIYKQGIWTHSIPWRI